MVRHKGQNTAGHAPAADHARSQAAADGCGAPSPAPHFCLSGDGVLFLAHAAELSFQPAAVAYSPLLPA